jgi:hypothetical protein
MGDDRMMREMNQRFLRDVAASDEIAANAEPARDDGALAPYLVEAFAATSEQGAFASECTVIAKWGSAALFRSSLTGQYGVGIVAGSEALRVVDCYQFSCLATAIRMFIELGSEPSRAIR